MHDRRLVGMKAALWAEVDRRRDHFVDILAETIRRPSDNPPGDTTQVAEYLRSVLAGAGLSVEVLAPQPHMPNLVSRYVGAAEGRHLILNGHLDQFPVEDPSAWSVAPYGGEVRDGRIYGRGASDMKGGTVALAAAMILLAELRVPLKGRVTGTFVSDEETGGRWGTAWP
ncbi:MAG: M20/M25/M40 family metallo-hydrolase [Bacillota bacterium]